MELSQAREIPGRIRHSGLPQAPLEWPVFSAYEVGKIVLPLAELSGELGGASPVLSEDCSTLTLFQIYRKFPRADFFPVQRSDGKIVGYLRRQMFFASLSQNEFTRDLLLRAEISVSSLMDPRVAVIDAYARLSDASEVLMRRDEELRFDPFVVVLDGHVIGISSVRRLLEGLNRYFRMDMEACARAQQAMLSPASNGVEQRSLCESRVRALTAPGGDLAGSMELSERLSLHYLFDVCGKGLPAAQMTLALGAALRTRFAEPWPAHIDLRHSGFYQHLRMLNRLCFEMSAEGVYATGIVLLFDKQSLAVRLFDYGHALAFLGRGARVFDLCARLVGRQSETPPFFGIDPEVRPAHLSYQLQRGDLLLLCSDGVVEQKNQRSVEWGREGLSSALRSVDRQAGPAAALDWMEAAWNAFRGNARISDDRSWFALRV
ncbi:MAG: SpoIIE family protein phosphatase [Leptospirales bacterium]|nr:SpoIIE family protein phosphatase [Leptospirales bacterium]